MRLEIKVDFLEGAPARTQDRTQILEAISAAMRYAAKGVALAYGHKISFSYILNGIPSSDDD